MMERGQQQVKGAPQLDATRGHEVAAPPALSGGRRALALFAILCMTFMETLDGTIVNVALPTMQRELGVGGTEIQLVASVFLVVTCAFLLVFGRLGDILGKVRVFQAGVVLFVAGSALCAASGTLEFLVVARSVQALGVAASLANNQGIITEPHHRRRAGVDLPLGGHLPHQHPHRHHLARHRYVRAA